MYTVEDLREGEVGFLRPDGIRTGPTCSFPKSSIRRGSTTGSNSGAWRYATGRHNAGLAAPKPHRTFTRNESFSDYNRETRRANLPPRSGGGAHCWITLPSRPGSKDRNRKAFELGQEAARK